MSSSWFRNHEEPGCRAEGSCHQEDPCSAPVHHLFQLQQCHTLGWTGGNDKVNSWRQCLPQGYEVSPPARKKPLPMDTAP